MIVEAAWRGERVVRLKAGDPYVLGRGGEEAVALARAGVPFEVVPGVSSALAAPALAGIPVTHRGMASGLVVVSGHAEAAYAPVLASLPAEGLTVVVLMGSAERGGIRRSLARAGWSPDTPAAVVVNASQPDQRVWLGSLGTLEHAPAVAPGDAGVIVIGRVVSLATATHFSLPFVSEETSWQPSTIQRR
jgi:uroporphyrin-III C-methyltransferase/precorrin-2 dehydrogenase/sirohydrochlorin ferrochelatase